MIKLEIQKEKSKIQTSQENSPGKNNISGLGKKGKKNLKRGYQSIQDSEDEQDQQDFNEHDSALNSNQGYKIDLSSGKSDDGLEVKFDDIKEMSRKFVLPSE